MEGSGANKKGESDSAHDRQPQQHNQVPEKKFQLNKDKTDETGTKKETKSASCC